MNDAQARQPRGARDSAGPGPGQGARREDPEEGEPLEPCGAIEQRVLLLAPTAKDAAMTQRILGGAGIACAPCYKMEAVCHELEAGAGAVLLTEECMASAAVPAFVARLRRQPPWSDLPVLLLANGGADCVAGRRAMEFLGNVTVLERPVRMASLVSVIRTLLRARNRQYQIREHMLERERVTAALRDMTESERAARSEAERVSRVKDEFLATLSHELRTPLNAVLGWSQVLRGGARDEEDLAQGLETIERNARAQAQIIDDLLDMSRIISGKIRLDVRRIDLLPVIEAALDTVRTAADAREIRVHTTLDPRAGFVSGDPGRLQQVFWNLLSNAIKFTPQGGRVRVLLERVGPHVQVSVSDTGEGIKPEFLPHVFDRFRQADASTTRRHGGLGLGLAIVKQLVELHGGTIRARSEGAGHGSTFVVMLPLAVAHPDRPAEPGPPAPRAAAEPRATAPGCPTLNGLRLLVVDDEPDARALLKRLLENCGAAVVTAGSAAEALEDFRRGPPNVLVSDIGMPGEDGYALIRQVRTLGKGRGGETPAIALTAYAHPDDRVKAIASGFQMHVPKPVEPVELVNAIARLAAQEMTAPAPGVAEAPPRRADKG